MLHLAENNITPEDDNRSSVIDFISKKNILDQWFSDSFQWLFKCENLFGFDQLTGYDKERLYAYLAERYASFWFKKYSNPIMWNWTFFDISKQEKNV